MSDAAWVHEAAGLAADGVPFVVVTVTAAAGHAPREAGAKMLVTAEAAIGSIGGGNVEAEALQRAREMLAAGEAAPYEREVDLGLRPGEHGVQCCGGRLRLLFEPVAVRRHRIAIFGAGHVGWALVHVLRLLPVDVDVVDSRAGQLSAGPLDVPGQVATLRLQHAPVPESAVAALPAGCHVLVMTHDHAEDLAVLDMVLRRDDVGFVGLIGSEAKWRHFRRRLIEAGHDEATLARVTTPIGLPDVPGKAPGAVAIATAAQLVGIVAGPALESTRT